MEPREFMAKKQRVRESVEDFLKQKFAEYPSTEVCRAAQYAVLGGGHRWRALVAVAAGEIFAANALEIGLPGAGGAELAHAASLVLDDLPSMDNARSCIPELGYRYDPSILSNDGLRSRSE